jgi:hypothetical protein
MKKLMNRDFPLSPTPSVSGDPIGPQSKREARKSDKKDKAKVFIPYAAAPRDYSIESPEAKAARKKERIKTAAAAIGVVGAAVGGILTDIRYQRGADRIQGNHSREDVPFGKGYRAGKNKN